MIATVLRLLRRRSEGSSDRKTAPAKAAELSISNELKPSRAAVGSEDGVHGTLKALVEQLVRQPPPLYNPGNVPPRIQDCELNLITSPQQLATVVEQLSKLDRFALDVEHHSTHTYSGITCLVQISTGKRRVLESTAAHLPRERLHLQHSTAGSRGGSLQQRCPAMLRRRGPGLCDRRAGPGRQLARFAWRALQPRHLQGVPQGPHTPAPCASHPCSERSAVPGCDMHAEVAMGGVSVRCFDLCWADHITCSTSAVQLSCRCSMAEGTT